MQSVRLLPAFWCSPPATSRIRGWSGPANLLPWPTRGRLTLVLVGAGALLGVLFWVDFAGARRGYGTLAAVHAWVELPLLLLALGVSAESVGPADGDA